MCGGRWRTEGEGKKETVTQAGMHKTDKIQWERENGTSRGPEERHKERVIRRTVSGATKKGCSEL
jgi:hypothetical protein